MKNLNYLMNHIPYQIFKNISSKTYIIKKHEAVTNNPPIRIYVNKIERLLDIIRYFTEKFLKIFNSEFSNIEIWVTDQNSKPVDIEDKVNITLVIN